jgi:hypothetical protein
MYKVVIHFILDQIEVASINDFYVPGYKIIEAVDDYIKENCYELLNEVLYCGEDLMSEDIEWAEEIKRRFPNEGTYKWEITSLSSDE